MTLIGICGGSGSGKTTLVNALQKEIGEDRMGVISQDSYYKNHPDLSFEQRCKLNFDHPDAIDFRLFEKHLRLLQLGQSVEMPLYSFDTHLRNKQTKHISAKEYMVVEGILIFTNKKLFSLFDHSIFVSSDENARLKRRIERDIQERGRTESEVINRFKSTIKPMHDLFIEPHKKYADLVFDNSVNDFSNIEDFCKQLKNHI
jgi:uridine kinase